jgi:ABC-2 type transport system ATP-binding protein
MVPQKLRHVGVRLLPGREKRFQTFKAVGALEPTAFLFIACAACLVAVGTFHGLFVCSARLSRTEERDTMNDSNALDIRSALKTFGGNGGFALWKRANGDGKSSKAIAVNNVSFAVQRGEIFGVLGPNGSGKSTLIRLIATLLVPDGGQITVFGHDVARDPMAVRRLINRVSVEASFFKKLSPMENLMYGARLYGVNAKEAHEQVKVILTRLGLEEKAIYRPMEEMSRGMQQKVAIARAFLSRPILLLLDEPTTGLDPRSKHDVQAFVRELRDQHDATILLTTHDMIEADTLCDRIAIIDGGNIVALDTPENLKRHAPSTNGPAPTLEEVFLQLTGKKLVTEDQAE